MTHAISNEMNDSFIRAAFERCPSGLLVVDGSGVIRVVNAEIERLLGYARDELIGRPVETLIPARFAGGHEHHRQQYSKQPTARAMGAGRELAARHRDGREIPVEIGLSTIDTPDGSFILSTVVDVSERRHLEERLRQTHKLEAVGNLASGIAHDFNNILLGIMGYTELVREALESDPGLVADLDVVLDTARRGRDLVNRILMFTRQSEPNRQLIRVVDPIEDALHLLGATLPAGLEIHRSFDPDTPPIVADSMELHQIIMNLGTNATFAMKGSPGILDVRTGPVTVDRELVRRHPELHEGLYVRITVADTGAGMAPEVVPHIFDPFFTTKAPGEGTGLGLSVIARIIRSLQGHIIVTSHLGQGTSFEVYLPANLRTENLTESAQPFASERPCVLLVDDEVHLAKLGKRVLESANLQVAMYTSSLLALEAFRSTPERFALVVTDNTMPHLIGLELVRRIHEIRPDVPVMMVSGIGEVMSIDELRERGVRRLLPKPYASNELRTLALELIQTGAQEGGKSAPNLNEATRGRDEA